MSKTTCPRCGQQATVTFTRRGTERIHTHKRPGGTRCVSRAQEPAPGGLDNIDEDGSPLDADNDPDA
ncbi:MAG TPA: hypothetical protein VFB99_23910 [Vicinamibacterales bacterium]|nr:hypothetical protein [Vicinamibacterales bacterium]